MFFFVLLSQLSAIDATAVTGSEFRTECPCLKAFEKPIEWVSALDLDACWSLCNAYKTCVAFAYNADSKRCGIYSGDAIGYKRDAIFRWDCPGNPSEPPESASKWYWIHFFQNAPTTDCQTVKSGNPGSPDGYYDVRIRGKLVSAYCVMSGSSAQTFFDVEATATNGANVNGAGEQPTTIRIERVRVQYNECMIRAVRDDVTFYTVTLAGKHAADPPGSFLHFAGGGDCNGSPPAIPGGHDIDLSDTPFQFPAGMYFDLSEHTLIGGQKHEVTKILTPRRSSIYGWGWCTFVYTYTTETDVDDNTYSNVVPLILFTAE